MTLNEKVQEIRDKVAYDPSGRKPPLTLEHVVNALDSTLAVMAELTEKVGRPWPK